MVAAGSAEDMWLASCIVSYIWQYLGLQDASCKSRMTGKYGDPGRGAKLHIIDESIYQMIE